MYSGPLSYISMYIAPSAPLFFCTFFLMQFHFILNPSPPQVNLPLPPLPTPTPNNKIKMFKMDDSEKSSSATADRPIESYGSSITTSISDQVENRQLPAIPSRHRSAMEFRRQDSTPEETNQLLTRRHSGFSEPVPSFRGQINQMRDGMSLGLEGYSSSLNVLLIFVPISMIFGIFFNNATITFVTSFIGMIPLAMLLGKATEDIAEHTNETLGALVNVTFGNAVELIISISALQAGKMRLVRDTIAGSILSNLLLVLGSAFFFGGLIHHEQIVLPAVSEANADLLSFAVFGLSIPALYAVSGDQGFVAGSDDIISLVTSIGLLIIYAMYIFFQLYTHADLYTERTGDDVIIDSDTEQMEGGEAVGGQHEQIASLPVAMGILVWMVFLVAISSEFLVGSIDEFSKVAGLNQRFIAVILLPVVGNAVEHMSAILVARHDKIDLSIGIACGSSVQIALFAAPVLVVISWLTSGAHLTLNFDMFAILCIGFSVFIVNATMRDSRTNWLEGAVLVMCYFIIASVFFLMSDQ